MDKARHDVGPSEAQSKDGAFTFLAEKPRPALHDITNFANPSKAQSKESPISWKKLACKAKAQNQDVDMFDPPRMRPSIEETETPK